MKIVIAGATGLIGKALTNRLMAEKHTVVAMTRNVENATKHLPDEVQIVQWSPVSLSHVWTKEIDKVDAIINLSGYSVSEGRWTESRKTQILNSRVLSTKMITDAIQTGSIQPGIFLNGSAVGYYGFGDKPRTEDDGPGDGFLAEVCEKWEAQVQESSTKVSILRFGVVLSTDGGTLNKMLPVFKIGLGGKIGTGNQFFPWIDIDDAVSAIIFIMQKKLSGIFNLTAPNPVTNAEFTASLANELDRSAHFTVPGVLLKLTFGEMSDLLLKSQNILPQNLLNSRFTFKYPVIAQSLKHLIAQIPFQQNIRA